MLLGFSIIAHTANYNCTVVAFYQQTPMLEEIFNIYIILAGPVYMLLPNYQMTCNTSNALNIMCNISFKVIYFHNLSLLVSQ